MALKESSFIVASIKNGRDESSTSEQLNGCGILIGNLILVPRQDRNIWSREKLKQTGLHIVSLHPQFSAQEMNYLLDDAFIRIKKRIEGLLKSLDKCTVLMDDQCTVLVAEVKWIKEVLSSCWPGETCDEVNRVNDLADVLISRLFELSKVQVVRIVKIEN